MSQANHKLIFQDQFNGGVSAAGYNIGGATGIDTEINIPIHIEVNSSIKKSYLIYSSANNYDTLNTNITINNDIYSLSRTPISEKFEYFTNSNAGFYNLNICLMDVTNSISPLDNVINLKIEKQYLTNITLPAFTQFYFIILYENASLPKINIATYTNEQKIWIPINYTLSDHNKIDTS